MTLQPIFLWAYTILGLFGTLVYTMPEFGRWDTNVDKSTTLVYERSMMVGSEIRLRVLCQKTSKFNIAWILMQSPCFEMFFGVDAKKIASDMSDILITSNDVTFVRGSKNLSCVALVPEIVEGSSPIMPSENLLIIPNFKDQYMAIAPGLLAKVWGNGAHLLVLNITCPPNGCEMDTKIELEMHNPDGGYLSALEAPFLPFNGVMSALYAVAMLVWTALLVRFGRHLMRIQYFIGLILFLGLWEHLTFVAVFETLRKSGRVPSGAVYFGELLTCAKRTLIRILMLIACLGYGITKPRLGAIWFRRCLIIGLVFFILLLTESITRVAYHRLVTTPFRLAAVAILSLMDSAVMWWMITYLARTLRETRMHQNAVKYRLYRHFSYVLIVTFLVSLVFLIASFELFKHHPCIKTWRYLWIDESFWQLVFFLLVVIIMILWRPSMNNRDYAYSLFDNVLDDDDDEEDVILDRLDQSGTDSEVRSRQTDADNKRLGNNSQVDPSKDTVGPPKGPIPASLMERVAIEATSGPNEQAPVWKVD